MRKYIVSALMVILSACAANDGKQTDSGAPPKGRQPERKNEPESGPRVQEEKIGESHKLVIKVDGSMILVPVPIRAKLKQYGFPNANLSFILDQSGKSMREKCAGFFADAEVMLRREKEALDSHDFSAARIYHENFLRDVEFGNAEAGSFLLEFALDSDQSAREIVAHAKSMESKDLEKVRAFNQRDDILASEVSNDDSAHSVIGKRPLSRPYSGRWAAPLSLNQLCDIYLGRTVIQTPDNHVVGETQVKYLIE